MAEDGGQRTDGRFQNFEHLKPFDKELADSVGRWMYELLGDCAYKIKKVSDYKELEDLIAPLSNDSSGLVFRGHASSKWELLSRYERAQRKADESKENKMRTASGPGPYGSALGYAKSILGIKSDDRQFDGQLWAQLQHYDVSTPLMDWTESIDVALFFAFQFAPEPDTKTAAVFVADPAKINNWADKLDNFYSPPQFVCPEGFFDARLAAQKGVFMMHGFVPRALEKDVENLREPPCPSRALLKIEIPRSIHQRVSHELKNSGLTWEKLFPRSMDDICREVEQRVLKHLYEPEEPEQSFVLTWDGERGEYVEGKHN